MKFFLATLWFMLALSALLSVIFLSSQMNNSETTDEKSAFECGFLMKWEQAMTFSVNYFYITIIFLLFDLEILFITPLGMFSSSSWNTLMMLLLIIYFTLLLSMEWLNSMLEWSK